MFMWNKVGEQQKVGRKFGDRDKLVQCVGLGKRTRLAECINIYLICDAADCLQPIRMGR